MKLPWQHRPAVTVFFLLMRVMLLICVYGDVRLHVAVAAIMSARTQISTSSAA